MLVTGKKSKSLSYEFRFRRLESTGASEIARGRLTVVCVTRDSAGKMSATAIPRAIAEQIEVAPAELLAA